MTVLIACVGNIFLGDDGFGVEVARRLRDRPLPDGVSVRDFGIRSIDLTYALLDGVDTAILVDAAKRGSPPGTLYVIEPELHAEPTLAPTLDAPLLSPHDMDPSKVLRLLSMMGGGCRRIVVVGCEPESFSDEGVDGRMGLSEPVAAAVDPAISLIESMVATEIEGQRLASSPALC